MRLHTREPSTVPRASFTGKEKLISNHPNYQIMDTVALLKIQDSFDETLREVIKLIGGLRELESPLIMKPNICMKLNSE